jgi:MFS family permease
MGIALAMTATGDIFPPAERARWAGLFGAVYGLSSVIGPSLGGWLTDHGLLLGTLVTDTTRWRWVFYINLPLGVIALAALLVYLPANISVRSSHFAGWALVRRIDWLGGTVAAAASVCLLLGLTWGGNQVYAWNSPQVIGILVAAGALAALFFLVEHMAVEPILPLDLFQNRNFTMVSILSLLQLMVLIGLVVYLPLYLQGVLGESASNSGTVLTPLTLAAVVGSMVGAFALVKIKSNRIISIASAAIMTIGAVGLLHFGATTGTAETLIVMVIIGLGLGPFFVVPPLAAQNALPPSRLGVGTAGVRYMGQLGSVLGVAIVGTVVNTSLAADLPSRLKHVAGIGNMPATVVQQASNPQALVNPDLRNGLMHGVARHVPPQVQAGVLHTLSQIFSVLKQSLMVGLHHGFVVLLVLSAAMILFAALLKDIPLRETHDEAPTDERKDEAPREMAIPMA